MDVEVRELRPPELPAAVELVARGMRDNPLNVKAMGSDDERRLFRLRKMFRASLPSTARKGVLVGAFHDRCLVGVLAWVLPGKCQTPLGEKISLAARMLPGVGPGSLARIRRWQEDWNKHDFAESHWHLGPVAVDPELQGRRIGSKMMANCCSRLDTAQAAAYLETDKADNVRFYEKFGFTTIAEAKVLGVPNWFMLRFTRL
jgi:GNAT superfamily N-acetyltransferase